MRIFYGLLWIKAVHGRAWEGVLDIEAGPSPDPAIVGD